MQPKIIPAGLINQILSPKVQRRFWEKVEIRDNEDCWPWVFGISNNGYGVFGLRYQGKTIVRHAHKIAWISSNRIDVPNGLYVLHLCEGNRRCCNPNHLKLGTHQDNMDDMVTQKRCGFLNVRGESHPSSRLTNDIVIRIRSDFASGRFTKSELAKKFRMCFTQIHSIVLRRTWKHI